jgi:hypothetical protein
VREPSSYWKHHFLKVLFESDNEKLTKLVHDTEGAIFFRLQELAGSTDHHEERTELHVACATLLSIQVSKLGWPSGLPCKPELLPASSQHARKASPPEQRQAGEVA